MVVGVVPRCRLCRQALLRSRAAVVCLVLTEAALPVGVGADSGDAAPPLGTAAALHLGRVRVRVGVMVRIRVRVKVKVNSNPNPNLNPNLTLTRRRAAAGSTSARAPHPRAPG